MYMRANNHQRQTDNDPTPQDVESGHCSDTETLCFLMMNVDWRLDKVWILRLSPEWRQTLLLWNLLNETQIKAEPVDHRLHRPKLSLNPEMSYWLLTYTDFLWMTTSLIAAFKYSLWNHIHAYCIMCTSIHKAGLYNNYISEMGLGI